MKQWIVICIAVAGALAACTSTQGYKITGTVENSADGAVVYLAERIGRTYTYLDSAVISNGTFTLKGTADTAKVRYLVAPTANITTGIVLENGNIYAAMGSIDSIGGTPENDAYQVFLTRINNWESDEQGTETIREELRKNIGSPVGYLIMRNYSYYLPYDEVGAFIDQMSPAYQADPYIAELKVKVAESAKTAVGQKFTDLAMKTPEGKDIKLSDYAGKGKYVLVDFWASWCPPCREETPKLVALYKKYAGKDFEIVGVSFDRTEAEGGLEAWKKGIKDLNITWPQMSDLKYWDSEGATVYAVRAIPHLMLIDRDGTILARNLSADAATAKITELLK
jgi:thiol-disulfide isomerase/thioredoxin